MKRMSTLATLGVLLSVLLWLFAYIAFDYIFVDVKGDREVYVHRANLAVVFSTLAVLSATAATWLSGYTFAAAKVRASITALLCAGFVGALLSIYLAENFKLVELVGTFLR
jgi:hypothetical protein